MLLSESRKAWLSLERYEVAVIGGSIAGLTVASELAKRGISVCVFEEHNEIGEPEKCDGLVSLNLLRRFGYQPSLGTIQDMIKRGVLHSPSGKELSFETGKMELAVLDRSLYDMQLYKTAEYRGADVRTGTRVKKFRSQGALFEVITEKEAVNTGFVVDATGPSSAPRQGIIPAAKYELEADWIDDSSFHVFFDQRYFPGFFGWIISSGKKRAKIGAAGRGINPFYSLEYLLLGKEYTPIKKIGSPIYVGGPSYPFSEGKIVKVGESAGQVKPTTAGGISLAVASSVIAARWIAETIDSSNIMLLQNYQKDWIRMFGREMRLMLSTRKFFESLSNSDLNKFFSVAVERGMDKYIGNADFDFHISTVIRRIGIRNIVNIAGIYLTSLIKSFF